MYQPPASGLRAAAPVTVGAVESYLIVNDFVTALPALSVQVPLRAIAPPSGPPYVPFPLHEARPEPPSSPLNETEMGFVYHPSASGSRERLAFICGGEESFATVTLLP